MTTLTTPEMLSVPVRGGELAVARWGDGPVVLALHGITANYVSWTYVAEALGHDVTLVAPDLRGRGESADLPGPWGLGTHVEDVVAILDHLGLEHAPIVGHSMGAFVAVKAAGLHPERFPSVLLIDGGVRIPVEIPEGKDIDDVLQAVIGPAMERLTTVLETRDEWHVRWRAHPAFANDWGPLAEAYVDHDIHAVDGGFGSRVRIDAIREDGRDTLVDESLTSVFAAGPVPMRLAWAPRGLMDGDPLYPRELVDAQADQHDHLSVHHLDDVNHYTVLLGRSGAAQVADEIRRLAAR